jgi:hypothetical protein
VPVVLLTVAQPPPDIPHGNNVPRLTARGARRWLVLHASHLTSTSGSQIALVLRSLPAKTIPKTIPRTLPVTLNTANDQIKAIFAKAGVGSRGDLLATVFRITACQGCSRRPGKVTALSARPGHHGPTQ